MTGEAPAGGPLISYFTGTGNSLLVARKLAERLEAAAPRPLMELLRSPESAGPEVGGPESAEAEAFGLVFPIYFDRMPEIVRSALETGPLPAAPYVFAITTSGEKTGNALSAVDAVLRRRGRRLDYGVNIPLADNSIILSTPQATMEDRLGRLDEVADGIARAVKDCARNDVPGQRSASLAAMGRVNEFGFLHLYKAERRIVDRERCSRCGLCSKLCPVGNISTREGEVDIGRDCRWCFACLNWCPQQAIRFGRIDPSVKGQYRCLGMTAGDIRRAST